MARYEVTGPDGGRYEVTAPDDATNDQIMQFVQSQAKAPASNPYARTAKSDSNTQNFLAGIGGAMYGPYVGLKQRLGLAGPGEVADYQKSMAGLRETPLGAAGAMAGSFAAAAPLVLAPGANTLAGAALAGGLYGAAEPTAAGESVLKNAAAGAAGGALGTGAGKLLGRALNPVRPANPVAMSESQQLASRYGVDLTPAQATGSRALAGLEGTLSQLPGSAGVMSKVAQGQREAFNRAAMNTLGESGNIGNDAALLARQNIGGRIEQAAAGAKIPVDDALLNDLASVETKYAKNLTPDQKPIVQQYMDDILNQGPAIDGASYQTWRSRIGARAASTNDSELKGALKGIQSALDSAFDRSAGPGASAAMQTARGQYRNFKTLEPLIEKASMSSNNIPPAQVLNRALATGNTQGEMGGLAQLGQIMGKEYPNSGTVPRLFWQDLMTNPLHILNPSYAIGATGVPYLAAKTLTSAPAESYLTHGLLRISPERERALMALGGLLGIGAAAQ